MRDPDLSVSTKSCRPAEASFSNKDKATKLFEKLMIERERNPSWVPFPLSSFPVSFRFSVCLQSKDRRGFPLACPFCIPAERSAFMRWFFRFCVQAVQPACCSGILFQMTLYHCSLGR